MSSQNFIFPNIYANDLSLNMIWDVLIPSLLICFIIFSTLLEILPRYFVSEPRNFCVLSLFSYFSIIGQALWLSNPPQAEHSNRQVTIFDLLLQIPFQANVPSFIAGMIMALLFLSSKTHERIAIHGNKGRLIIVISTFILIITASFTTEKYLVFFDSKKIPTFPIALLISGGLVPLFSILVWYIAEKDFFTNTNSNFDIGTTENVCKSFSFSSPSDFFLLSYAIFFPCWKFIIHKKCYMYRNENGHSNFFCERFNIYNENQILNLKMVKQSSQIPLYLLKKVANSFQPSENMISIIFPLLLFVLLVLTCGTILFFSISRPFQKVTNQICMNEEEIDSSLGPSNILRTLREKIPFFPSIGKSAYPPRGISFSQKIAKKVIFYVFFVLFFSILLQYNKPVSLEWMESNRSTSGRYKTCFFMNSWEIHQKAGNFSKILFAFLSKFCGILDLVITVLCWTPVTALPVMLFNLAGHLIYPRVTWKDLPLVTDMINERYSEDIERQVLSFKKRIVSSDDEENEHLTMKSTSEDKDGYYTDFKMFLRYVTRGRNEQLVKRNLKKAIEILQQSQLPSTMWHIEVVTDNALNLEDKFTLHNVSEILVPQSYETKRKAQFKARALNYAIEASTASGMDWIIHLDEETKFDVDTVRAILFHCQIENNSTWISKTQKWPKIGQGLIIFGQAMTESEEDGGTRNSGNWFTTLADSVRVSDDCGRFRLQYENGEAWSGMHGSFVVVANVVEQEITFDHGAAGSIAEDAYFALLARSKGVRFSWIDALMFEQSPFTISDFVKQRARWLVGGYLVVTTDRIPFLYRIMMRILIMIWIIMPITYPMLFLSICLGRLFINSPNQMFYFYQVFLPLVSTVSLWIYVMGFMTTFSISKIGLLRYTILMYLQILLSPLLGGLELLSVIYAVINMKTLSQRFHVVEKDYGAKTEEKTSLKNERSYLNPRSESDYESID